MPAPGTLFCKKYFVINLEEERGRNEKRIFTVMAAALVVSGMPVMAKETSI